MKLYNLRKTGLRFFNNHKRTQDFGSGWGEVQRYPQLKIKCRRKISENSKKELAHFHSKVRISCTLKVMFRAKKFFLVIKLSVGFLLFHFLFLCFSVWKFQLLYKVDLSYLITNRFLKVLLETMSNSWFSCDFLIDLNRISSNFSLRNFLKKSM